MKKEKKEKKSVLFFYDLLENILLLNDQEAGQVIKAIFNYEMYGFYEDFEEPKKQMIYKKAVKMCDYGSVFFEKKFNGVDNETE